MFGFSRWGRGRPGWRWPRPCAALAFEDALVLSRCLREGTTVTGALSDFVTRRTPRTGWVREQTTRRDRTRNLPPVLRDPILRALGQRIFHSNYRPLRTTP